MNTDMKARIMFGAGGLVVGTVVAMNIGFSWGGWTTSSTTTEITDKAILANNAAICVARFIKDPNYEDNLKKFERLDSYGMNNTSDYVRKFGWGKMPGEEKADSDVCQACAKGIEALIKK